MENQVALETKDSAGELYVAFELSRKEWKLGFSDGKAAGIRKVSIEARDLEAVRKEIEKAKRRFGLNESATVRCYEAGHLSRKLCLKPESYGSLKPRLKHGIQLRQHRIDTMIGSAPLTILE